MIYINHNNAIEQLQDLINNSLHNTKSYLPDNFNNEQSHALELLKTRIALEEIVEESVYFNKQLNFESKNKNLSLVSNVEELIEVFKLRSTVYTNIGYQREFPDFIEGLNYDKYDKNAAILFYTSNSTATGTTRLIFDSKNKLPTEKKTSFYKIRDKYNNIGELSRLTVKTEDKGLSLEFKYLMQGIHNLFINNEIDITVLAIIKEHYKLYTKFGGSEIIQEMDDYGNLGHEMFLLSWDPALASTFFKRAFLT